MSELRVSDSRGCRNVGMPLGGIGAGSLELRPDGYFHGWYLMNNRPWGSGPETDAMERFGLRFGATCDWGEGVRCVNLGEHPGLDPKGDGWFWVSDPYHLPWVQHPEKIEYEAHLPVARLAYRFEQLPLEFSLRAFSPLVPHQASDSNTPGVMLEFTVANQSQHPARITLMGLLKNAVGYDRPDLPSRCALHDGPPAGFVFSRDGLDAQHNTGGSMGLFVHTDGEHDVSTAVHVLHGRDLWDALMHTGRLTTAGDVEGDVGEIGAHQASGAVGLQRSALAAEVTVEPQQRRTVRFYLTWHFPHFWELSRRDRVKDVPPAQIGVQYAQRFESASAVADWLHSNADRLLGESLRFRDAFFASTQPRWLLEAAWASWAVLLRAAWWDAQGRFGVWEGLGCCGMQTVDVGHYGSLGILQLFPELETSANRLSAANLEPDGKIPHLMPGNFACSDFGGDRGRIDLPAQFILAVWRNALWRGDLSAARELWPVLRRQLELLQSYDTDGDGLPNNQGPDQTYDRFPLKGTSALVGLQYIAALLAAADLAQWLQEAGAEEMRRQAADARQRLWEQLWNGEYLNLSHDSASGESNRGCMTDQLNGDWYYRQACGQGLLDDEHARSALGAVLKHNRRSAGPMAWLANCSWPVGDGVELPRQGSDQVNCPWSGVEYAVGSHLVMLGEREAGREVAADVFRRYEDAGMRLNHIECGQFYYRAMSAWGIYQAEIGLCWDGLRRRLQLARPQTDDARFVIVLPTGYAQARWDVAQERLTLECLGGSLRIDQLQFGGRDVQMTSIHLQSGEQMTLTTG